MTIESKTNSDYDYKALPANEKVRETFHESMFPLRESTSPLAPLTAFFVSFFRTLAILATLPLSVPFLILKSKKIEPLNKVFDSFSDSELKSLLSLLTSQNLNPAQKKRLVLLAKRLETDNGPLLRFIGKTPEQKQVIAWKDALIKRGDTLYEELPLEDKIYVAIYNHRLVANQSELREDTQDVLNNTDMINKCPREFTRRFLNTDEWQYLTLCEHGAITEIKPKNGIDLRDRLKRMGGDYLIAALITCKGIIVNSITKRLQAILGDQYFEMNIKNGKTYKGILEKLDANTFKLTMVDKIIATIATTVTEKEFPYTEEFILNIKDGTINPSFRPLNKEPAARVRS